MGALLLGLLSIAALLVHGYHPFAEDAEIYLPGVEKILHPELFPVGAEFFASHAHLTLFPNLIALSVRATHLPFEVVLFLWYLGSVFLLLLACCEVGEKCFATPKARWAGVAIVASLLTLPVAGTALYIMDQYPNPRNLAAFAGIFAIARVLDAKYIRAGLWLLFAGLVHPLMAVFAFSFCALLLIQQQPWSELQFLGFLLPFGISFDPPSPAYREAARFHAFHYIMSWQWYEWLGIVAPVAVLWWFSWIARKRQLQCLDRMCRALIIYDLVYFAAALVVSVPRRFESLARIQPLRSLHLLYVLMLLFAGGLAAEFILKDRTRRWAALFLPICAGMFLPQRALFPASAHVELPGIAPKNNWAQAFRWIRDNTPTDAMFAIDPFYMRIPGEDNVGFRALAQRSRLADASKDSGAVSMFPPLAEEWLEQFQAQRDWKQFDVQDLLQLRGRYGVTWVVLQPPGIPGLKCPYRNGEVLVCRVEP
jgi:hypothetical protein